ncbi:MAG: class I SAM-dependent methyltransferase, partial [Bacteroidota bacterium]
MNDFKHAWNEYWQTGLTTSCVSNGNDGYPPAIKEFWIKNAFSNLKTHNKVIDLCSGGGGVPKLIIDYCSVNNINLEIAITDLAQIQENIQSTNNIDIRYYPECNCEDLPFKNQSYHFVSSSFGIEYSHLEQTLMEIHRILKLGGIFSSVMHCSGSEIVKNSQSQSTQAHEVLYKLKFFNLFRNIFLARSKPLAIQRSKEKKLLNCLNVIKIKLLHDNQLHIFRSILKASHDIFVFSQANKSLKCIEYVNEMEKALIYNNQRMKNLAQVVLSE